MKITFAILIFTVIGVIGSDQGWYDDIELPQRSAHAGNNKAVTDMSYCITYIDTGEVPSNWYYESSYHDYCSIKFNNQ